jgi:hypothetical protein
LKFPPNEQFIEISTHATKSSPIRGVNPDRVSFYKYYPDNPDLLRSGLVVPKLEIWVDDDVAPTTFEYEQAERLFLALHINAFDISRMDIEDLRKLAYPNKKE